MFFYCAITDLGRNTRTPIIIASCLENNIIAWFPSPTQLVFALSSSFVFMEESRAAAPKEDKVLENGEIFRSFISPSILAGWLVGWARGVGD